MNDVYCSCGIRLRQWFNDVFSCPRCQTIVLRKDHVSLTWRGPQAVVLLDELEKHVTKVLLAHRHEARQHTCAIVQSAVVPEELLEVAPKPIRPGRQCDCCDTSMEAGCGKTCPNCGWVSPCSTG